MLRSGWFRIIRRQHWEIEVAPVRPTFSHVEQFSLVRREAIASHFPTRAAGDAEKTRKTTARDIYVYGQQLHRYATISPFTHYISHLVYIHSIIITRYFLFNKQNNSIQI